MSEGASKRWRPDWPWTGLILSVAFLAAIGLLPCLGSGNCYQETKTTKQHYSQRQPLPSIQIESKRGEPKKQSKPCENPPEGCVIAFVRWAWGAGGRYVAKVQDDPVALFTGFLVIVSGWQGLLILRAERSTQRSLAIGRRQVDAATNADRARFFPSPINLVRASPTDPHPFIRWAFINYGRTPAILIGISIECALVTSVPLDPVYNPQKLKTSHIAVGPNITVGSDSNVGFAVCPVDTALTPEDYEAIGNRARWLLVKGFVIFRDIFGDKYVQCFGAVWRPKTDDFANVWIDAYSRETKVPEDKTPD